jgi:mono/diheme cytochrome c family protein
MHAWTVRNRVAACCVLGTLLLCTSDGDRYLFAQSSGESSQPASQSPAQPASDAKGASEQSGEVDPYDRAAVFYAYQRAAKNGWQRGQEIFYVRCWMCHSGAVSSRDRYPSLSLRDVVARNDAKYVEMMVRAGTTRMPSYSLDTLSDEALNDLISFLSEKCGSAETGVCFDEREPPDNPLYRLPREMVPTVLEPSGSGS